MLCYVCLHVRMLDSVAVIYCKTSIFHDLGDITKITGRNLSCYFNVLLSPASKSAPKLRVPKECNEIFIHRTMVAYTQKRNLIKQSDYDNAVTEWQNNPEASD